MPILEHRNIGACKCQALVIRSDKRSVLAKCLWWRARASEDLTELQECMNGCRAQQCLSWMRHSCRHAAHACTRTHKNTHSVVGKDVPSYVHAFFMKRSSS
eukprot:scaffold240671_cov14-Tisochrysis_lutea.AAC.2